MTVFWWIAGTIVLLSFAITSGAFMANIATGDERYKDVAAAAWRWTVVFGLGTFNIAIFKHIVWTLLQIWGIVS
ncbi:MAG TPA: hypothetical protein VFR90_04210 [Methylibium sp.]|uniref:hypothetical protein n=1 Tax=Methylibium sp. TaxID=2067992 RepID=UPI002DBD1C03|nr:hypothetical protein [Methylibium sp.]HEU4458304.1 hypothetical protein [Methylibium sp.]